TPARDEVVNSARSGYQWQASIEVAPLKIEQLDRGATVNINGRKFVGPLYRISSGRLTGFAFVSHGADDDTSGSIAATKRRRGNSMKRSIDQTFAEFVSATRPGTDIADLTHLEAARSHAHWRGESSPVAIDFEATAPLIFASADAVESEDRRIEQIERATRGS